VNLLSDKRVEYHGGLALAYSSEVSLLWEAEVVPYPLTAFDPYRTHEQLKPPKDRRQYEPINDEFHWGHVISKRNKMSGKLRVRRQAHEWTPTEANRLRQDDHWHDSDDLGAHTQAQNPVHLPREATVNPTHEESAQETEPEIQQQLEQKVLRPEDRPTQGA
jgi:hypothetical protein